jgi:hypothetical protein
MKMLDRQAFEKKLLDRSVGLNEIIERDVRMELSQGQA